MKLRSMTMENFRQFFGTQRIVFSETDTNITIIVGQNGNGKTGIFRALLFALYGKIKIDQDDPREKVHIVNFTQLDQNVGKPVTSRVSVCFNHEDCVFTIERSLQAIKEKSGRLIENDGKVILTKVDSKGDTQPIITDNFEIRQIINQIMHEDIQKFFLFDAEKMETLTKTKESEKKELKTGIISLLQIDKLDKARDLVRKLSLEENRSLVERSRNNDLQSKSNERDHLESKLDELKEKGPSLINNRVVLEEEIKAIDIKLSENKEIKQIQQLKDRENESLLIQRKLLDKNKEALQDLLRETGTLLLIKDVLPQTQIKIKSLRKKHSDPVPLHTIEESLENGRCVCCGNNLGQDHRAKHYLEALKENYKRSEWTGILNNLSVTLSKTAAQGDKWMDKLDEGLKEYRHEKNKSRHMAKKIDDYTNEIGNKAKTLEHLSELEKSREVRTELLHKTVDEIAYNNTQITQLIDKKKTLESEIDKMVKKIENLKQDYKLNQLIKQMYESIDGVIKDYSSDTRQKLTREITNIFQVLIDVKDKQLVKKVEINEKYEIDVIGWNNQLITLDLSQGQRQILSLSFVCALAKLASHGNRQIEFPLFMDSPFGRISLDNRKNLIQRIPLLTSQWILLLTDTEFTDTEKHEFIETRKIGKIYQLKQINNGFTKIEELTSQGSVIE